MLELDLNQDEVQYGTNIKLIGVGGAGGNAIDSMIDNNLKGVEFITANTNIMDLKRSKSKITLQLGKKLTKGLGAGANPEIGKKAAEESSEDIKNYIQDADMLFIAAGMGGGTGTGASPIIAALAKEMNILTIGIVNTPFKSEGKKRMKNALFGVEELKKNVDTLLVVPNEKLIDVSDDMTFLNAFQKANDILYGAVKGITDIIHHSGYINVDFADIQAIMKNKGSALMGIGIGEGEDRAADAVKKAMNNPLLDNVRIENAQGVMINITTSSDFKMSEFNTITNLVIDKTGDNGDIIYGIVIDDELENKIKVTLIATGLDSPKTIDFPTEREVADGMNEDNEEEDISATLDRIRNQDSIRINKNSSRNPQHSRDSQMEIPAFLRKFSN